jgi:hypothetical protein
MKSEHYCRKWIEEPHSSSEIDSWRALEEEGATEQALNDLLGYLEDDLKRS